MNNYTSRAFVIKKDVQTVFELFRNPLSAQSFVEKVGDKLPVKDLKLTEDTVEVTTGVVGKVILTRTEEREPHLVRYTGTHSPVPLTISIMLSPHEEEATKAQIAVDVDVPSFISGMVKSKIEPVLEKLADQLEALDVDRFLGVK